MTIRLEQIHFHYPGGPPVFSNFSFTLPEQGTLLLTAPSGRGKTTLLRLIAGLEQPQAGTIHGAGQLQFAWVFQQDRLLPWATVWQNAALSGDPQRAKHYLTALGLEGKLQQYPASLSGGMARRVAIARALTYGGDVVLLDEAFNGLDLQNQQIAANLFCQRFRLRLLVTHRQEEAAFFPDIQRLSLT